MQGRGTANEVMHGHRQTVRFLACRAACRPDASYWSGIARLTPSADRICQRRQDQSSELFKRMSVPIKRRFAGRECFDQFLTHQNRTQLL